MNSYLNIVKRVLRLLMFTMYTSCFQVFCLSNWSCFGSGKAVH